MNSLALQCRATSDSETRNGILRTAVQQLLEDDDVHAIVWSGGEY
jgi:hypothetical protein